MFNSVTKKIKPTSKYKALHNNFSNKHIVDLLPFLQFLHKKQGYNLVKM